MRDFIKIAVSLGLVLPSVGVCTSNIDQKLPKVKQENKAKPNESAQKSPQIDQSENKNLDESAKIQKLFKITEITESVIKEKWLPLLNDLEKDVVSTKNLDEVTDRCSLFIDSLLHLTKRTMAEERNEILNSLILNMSARSVEVARKIKNVMTKVDSFDAYAFWYAICAKHNNIRVLNLMNLLTFNDSYDSHEVVSHELLDMSNLYEPMPNFQNEIVFDNIALVEKFYAKLQKIGCYDVTYSKRIKQFLDYIKKIATKSDNKNKEDARWRQIYELFEVNEISEDVVLKKWIPCFRLLERDTPEQAGNWCHWFSNSLAYLAKSVMVDGRNPNINSLILDMSTKLVEITRKARNAQLKALPEQDAEASNETIANTMWLNVTGNDHNIRIWNIMNLVAYDDEYNSLETIEFELDNIGNIVNRSIGPNVYFNAGCNDKVSKLIENFYAKLQKVGNYNIKHSEPVRKFLEHVEKYVQNLKNKETNSQN